MSRRAPKMFGDICPNCARPHGPPVCDHDPDRPCHTCGKPVGLLWDDVDGRTCWFCAWEYARPEPKPAGITDKSDADIPL